MFRTTWVIRMNKRKTYGRPPLFERLDDLWFRFEIALGGGFKGDSIPFIHSTNSENSGGPPSIEVMTSEQTLCVLRSNQFDNSNCCFKSSYSLVLATLKRIYTAVVML